MKNICFIGAFDKLDLILYVAKILSSMNKKILTNTIFNIYNK